MPMRKPKTNIQKRERPGMIKGKDEARITRERGKEKRDREK